MLFPPAEVSLHGAAAVKLCVLIGLNECVGKAIRLRNIEGSITVDAAATFCTAVL